MDHFDQMGLIYSLYKEIKSRLDAGADFVIGKIPGGDHYLIHRIDCTGGAYSKWMHEQRDTHAAGYREIIGLIDSQRDEHTIDILRADIPTKAPSTVRDAIHGVVARSTS